MSDEESVVVKARLEQTLDAASSAIANKQEWANRVRANWRRQPPASSQESGNSRRAITDLKTG
jgi:hypothetical protein